ncbi:hypothetical protein TcasGA2_TC001717 [Tribolium castaneum]|uniref:Uncharacterized protein n=1 Tax=Tribolium castaneum TaxID=7070 RepID=D6W896_TRICA|nr:hypothetical protein TcasGA2_TC001717 [Tribolium castaneum]
MLLVEHQSRTESISNHVAATLVIDCILCEYTAKIRGGSSGGGGGRLILQQIRLNGSRPAIAISGECVTLRDGRQTLQTPTHKKVAATGTNRRSRTGMLSEYIRRSAKELPDPSWKNYTTIIRGLKRNHERVLDVLSSGIVSDRVVWKNE